MDALQFVKYEQSDVEAVGEILLNCERASLELRP